MPTGNGKIDRQTFHRMVRAGKSQAEIAKYFGCSASAVSQYASAHKAAVSKSVALTHAHRLAKADVDLLEKASKQEARLLRAAELSWRIANGDPAALKQAGDVRSLLPRTQFSDPMVVYLQSLRQLTDLIRTKKELMMSMYDVSTAAEFQREVLEIIANTDPELRKEIIRRLKANKALAASIRIPRPSKVTP